MSYVLVRAHSIGLYDTSYLELLHAADRFRAVAGSTDKVLLNIATLVVRIIIGVKGKPT